MLKCNIEEMQIHPIFSKITKDFQKIIVNNESLLYNLLQERKHVPVIEVHGSIIRRLLVYPKKWRMLIFISCRQ
mgnify:CR=1 FL=1